MSDDVRPTVRRSWSPDLDQWAFDTQQEEPDLPWEVSVVGPPRFFRTWQEAMARAIDWSVTNDIRD